jgi:hypothetical protein
MNRNRKAVYHLQSESITESQIPNILTKSRILFKKENHKWNNYMEQAVHAVNNSIVKVAKKKLLKAMNTPNRKTNSTPGKQKNFLKNI